LTTELEKETTAFCENVRHKLDKTNEKELFTTYIANVLNVDRHFVELVWLKLRSIGRQINSPRLPSVTIQHHVELSVRVQDLSKAKTNCKDKVIRVKLRYVNNSVDNFVTVHEAFLWTYRVKSTQT